ncbi:hypothetical protein AB0C52_24745 [Streptomyces sp. NPDC048717]|uniref:Uncharacterized protein n=1 Tax=Streptomyces laurentii TaxID=39478 RepID=A0A160PAA1_STRLU|nr:hypothetical protein SLA_7194 [Streptomyces laurentii]
MKTCDRFEKIKSEFQFDITALTNHAARHAGTNPAMASSRIAKGVRLNMARALSRHYSRCKLCC